MEAMLKLIVVSFVLMAAVLTIGECQSCNITLIFPWEADSRTIRLARVTNLVNVNITLSCTDDFTSDVDAILMFSDPNGILTSNVNVPLPLNSPDNVYASVDITMLDKDGTGSETFDVTLSTSTADVTVLAGYDVLTFNRENIAEVSFDTSRVYQSPVGGSVTLFIDRSVPRRIGNLTIDEVVALDMRRQLSGLPATVSFAQGTSTVLVVIGIAHDDPLVQSVALVNFVESSFSSDLIGSRDPETRAAVVNIISPPVLSTKNIAIGVSSSSTSVSFSVVSSRRVDYDIAITLSYSGDLNIFSNRAPSLTLLAGEDEVDIIFPISSRGSNFFVVEIGASFQEAFINQEMKTTTYRIEAPVVFISILERSFTVREGDFVVITLLTNIPAPFQITIDVYTPLSTEAGELSNLERVVIGVGGSRVDVTIGVVEDGVSEQPELVTVVFQSLTPGAVVERIADSVSITILGSSGGTGGFNPPVVNRDPGDTSNDEALSRGAIAGIIIAVVVGLIFFVTLMMCYLFAVCFLCSGFRAF